MISSERHSCSPSESMDDIVISGVAGRFPEANNIEEFAKNLFDGVDMVTENDRRWKPGLYGLPRRHGKIKEVEFFDAAFFNIHAKQVNNMDPQMRILLECAYEAIVDAGFNPRELRGSKTGVYIGCSFSDAQIAFSMNADTVEGYGMTGSTLSMFANRMSFFFDFKGPSQTVDTACSSTFYAFENAYKALLNGTCDYALVGGSHLTFRPHFSLQFMRLNMLSMDGTCRSFDANGSGYVRSETIGVFFLQRRSSARRCYAQVVNAKCNNDGWKTDGITFPSSYMQKTLMKKVYEESGVDPKSVVYYEAHGTGTKAGDPQELNAATEIFCQNRQSPLLIGSVKSNCGHAEPASGVASIAKVLIAINYGIIPANLHFSTPNPDIPGLSDGRLEVVTSATRLPPGYIALNSSGFGGSNGHILLKPIAEEQEHEEEITLSSRLIYINSRTEEGVRNGLSYFTEKKKSSLQYLCNPYLFEEPFVQPFRGFSVSNGAKTITEVTKVKALQNRQVWFIFSGMGTHWFKMGRKLFEIGTFANSLKQSDSYLKPYGVELLEVFFSDDETVWNRIINTFVGIAAIQIALVDCLWQLGISPDGIIGHSVGELGCAYADKCFSAEETLLAAYYRGKCIEEANIPPGAMAAVGLTWQECIRRCPEGVYPACHNSRDTVTLSGPKESVEQFVAKLQESGVFAKSVDCLGVAFHSPFMKSIAPNLKASLEDVIKSKKLRSEKWISTSVTAKSWNTELAKYSSPAYHANNLCSPVLFQEALAFVPENAILIEIAPHCLLQAVLKRSVPASCNSFGLMKKNEDDLFFFLTSLGRMYNEGLKFDLFSLLGYTPSLRNVPFLSPVVCWDHSTSWKYPYVDKEFENNGGKTKFLIDLNDPKWSFIAGHRINDRILFPATGYLEIVWQCFAKSISSNFREVPVEFSNVEFVRATILSSDVPATLYVSLLDSSGKFQIEESNTVVVQGMISSLTSDSVFNENGIVDVNEKSFSFTDDIYKELGPRGYEYNGIFRCIHSVNSAGNFGYLEWNDNWVPYLDSLLQFIVLSDDGLKVPSRVEVLKIKPQLHLDSIKTVDDKIVLPVYFDADFGAISSGGVFIRGLHSTSLSKKVIQQNPVFKTAAVEFLKNEIIQNGEINCISEMDVFSKQLPNDGSPVMNGVANGFNNAMFTEDSTEHEFQANDKEASWCYKSCEYFTFSSEFENYFNIVFQNLNKTSFIYEVCLDRFSLFSRINDILKNFEDLSIDYTCISTGERDTYGLPKHVNFIKWDGISEISSLIDKSDLTIYNYGDTAKVVYDPVLFANLEDKATDSSFILMFSRTFDESPSSKELVDLEKSTTAQLNKRLHSSNYINLCSLSDKINRLTIFRHVVKYSRSVFSIDNSFSWIEKLKVEMRTDVERIWLLSVDDNSGIIGFFNSLRMEPNGHKLRCILSDKSSAADIKLLNTVMDADLTMTVLKNSCIGFYMYRNCDSELLPAAAKFSYANVSSRGDLSSLKWFFSEEPVKGSEEKTNVNVCFAALNFRDVMLATGKLLPDAIPDYRKLHGCLLGIEFSGTTDNNVRVMGLVPGRGMASNILVNKSFLFEVPSSWSLEDAATVPVVYCTVYYSLLVRGKLRAGERVLIHAGSGGVGIAAIRIAQSLNCEVFTTVSTDAKRNFLKSFFPSLQDDHIFNSRNADFEKKIMHATSGYGVDVVLNSLAGEMLQASVRVLHEHGRFLEIGKYDLQMNTALGMSFFLKNTSFHGILLDALFEKGNDEWLSVRNCLIDGINSGIVIPLPYKSFDRDSIESAFRYMAQGKHIGKIIIKVKNEDTVPVAMPQLWFYRDRSYLVTGGLGDLGLELTRFLLERGAGNVYLTSRKGVKTVYQARKLKYFNSQFDANVVVVSNDLQTVEQCEQLLSLINSKHPLAGVFHLAGILRDRLFENQTEDDFREVYFSKFRTASLLDAATRSLTLDHFVVFSSIAAGLGNPGQTNYAFANSALDRLCELRTRDGFPSISIQWGPIDDVGMFANLKRTTLGAIVGQKLESMFDIFEKAILGNHLSANKTRSVFMSYVLNQGGSESKISTEKKSLTEIVAGILGIKDVTTLNPNATLSELGLDSLGSVELGQILEKQYNLRLSGKEVQQMKICDLGKIDAGPDTKAAPTPSVSISIPTEVLIRMNDVKVGTPLFVVHPIEGYIDSLKEVMLLIKTPVYGLQCTADVPLDTMNSIAKYYYERICEVYPTGEFFISGYSFGTCVAFEIAHIASTRIKKLIFLDGSPRYILEHTRDFFEKQGNEKKIEIEAFYFFDTVIRINRDKAIEALLSYDDAQQREKVFHEMCEEMGFSDPDLIKALKVYIQRILVAFYYSPTLLKGHTPVTLIKAIDSSDSSSKAGYDYELSAICETVPVVVTLEGDHRTFITNNEGKELANALNNELTF